MSERENAATPHSSPAQTESGGIRWWRPDLVYRQIRAEFEGGRLDHIATTAFACTIGPFLNGVLEYNRQQQAELEAEMQKEKERVKQEEKWRLEAREEYKNDRE